MPAPRTLWTHRLVRQSLAIPNTPDYTEAEDDLVTLVQHVLEQGSDAPFLQAYDQLLRQGADQAAERLEFWAETCASTRDDPSCAIYYVSELKYDSSIVRQLGIYRLRNCAR